MKPPHFWRGGLDPKSRAASPVTRALLTPLAAVYAWLGARRIVKTKPYQPPVPVICIGNLTVGGAGKTPVAAAIRETLQSRNLRVGVLSRGYGGSQKGPLRVDTAAHEASDVGDEPLLLARSGEAWIARDRVAGVKAMAEAGLEVVILDDGHQNPTVAKALSLIVVDAGDPIGNGHVFPKGPLREPVATGLARAHAVIVMGDGEMPDVITSAGLPVIRGRLEPRECPPLGRLVAFAGIGRPDKFFDGLRAAGGDLVEDVPFPDHHAYKATDISYLKRLAAERDARLITTEKDHVRLSPSDREDILAFPVSATFDQQQTLDALLDNALKPAR